MFQLINVYGSCYFVLDTVDKDVDTLTKSDICKCLNMGLVIDGVSKISDTEFEYTDEYFIELPSNSDSDDDDYDDYDDYDYEDEDSSAEDDINTSGDSDNEDLSDEDEYDDYDDYDEDSSAEDDLDNEDSSESNEDDYDSSDEDDDYYEDDYDDYDDDEDEDISTVNRLYSFLSEEQIKLIKKYYLWYSQRIFEEGQRNQRTLQITQSPRKLQKQKKLNVMKNQGGLWAYAGFIDMGYKGADYCTLGHPLRYVHLAWDISVSDIEESFFGEQYSDNLDEILNSSNCIKFGIDCISDFFEIDKEYTDRLKKAQREAIKDMDFMCSFYEEGISDEVINSFSIMNEIVNKAIVIDAKARLLKGDGYKPLADRQLLNFYREFRKLHVVPPKSLIQELRDNFVGWETHKFIGVKEVDWGTISNLLVAFFGEDGDISGRYTGYKDIFRLYLEIYFKLKSCGYYEYNADTFKDEGGASKPVKKALKDSYTTIDKLFWSDTEYTFDFIQKLFTINKLIDKAGQVYDSYKTPQIIKDAQSGLYVDDVDSKVIDVGDLQGYSTQVDFNIEQLLDELSRAHRASRYLCRISYNETYRITDFITELSDKLEKANELLQGYLNYNSTKRQELRDRFNSDIQAEQVQEQTQEQAQKSSDDKPLTDDEILEYCKNNKSKIENDSSLKFPLEVLATVTKNNKYTSKQMYYIKKIYSALTGKSDIVSLDDRKDIEVAIDKVIENDDLLDGVADDKQRTISILNSIKRYRRISVRQMKYAEQALKAVDKTV